MKKKNFVTLLMSVAGGILFALGMCMALLTEWGVGTAGVAVGAAGLVVLLAMLPVRRRMEGRPAIAFHGKAVASTVFGIFAAGVFGVGMCMVTAWDRMVSGIVVGLVGIVLLLCLIPICKGLK